MIAKARAVIVSVDDAAAGPRPRAPRPARFRCGASVVLLAAMVAALLALPGSARAHARLVRSTPAEGAVLAASPHDIVLEFNELLDDEFNEIAVYRAKGDGAPTDAQSFTTGKPQVDAEKRTRLTAAVAPLAPGAYVVHWKVLSRDGHSALGRVLFRVGAAE